jgi:DNA-binding NarL/FixJ family response regulator
VDTQKQFAGLLDTLDLLVAQARAYERTLPRENHVARAAIDSMGKLAWQALNEAHDLADSLGPAIETSHPLSPRELEVLTLASEGLTNKEIAYRLGLSPRTIQFHMNAIFNKLGATSRTHAVSLALKQGWL